MKWIILFALLGALLGHGYQVWLLTQPDGAFSEWNYFEAYGATLLASRLPDYAGYTNEAANLMFGGAVGAVVGLGIRAVVGPDKPRVTAPPQPAAPPADDQLAAAKPPESTKEPDR